LLGIVPYTSAIAQHGGVSMFWTIGGFILLTLFAGAVAGGVIVGYRALSVIGLKGKLEATKVKVELENAEHGLRVVEHQHGQHILQLMEGESTKGVVAVPKDEAADELPPEVVSGEVEHPPLSDKEYFGRNRDQRDAEDADFRKIVRYP